MPVTDFYDRRARRRLARILGQLPRLTLMGAASDIDAWSPRPGSEAASAGGIDLRLPGVLPGFKVNLPLTQARAFLAQAADEFAAIGRLITSPESVRFASIGPLARAAAERSFTVTWVFDAEHGPSLARALAVELVGLENQLRYLRAAKQGLADSVETHRDEVLRAIDAELGRGSIARDGRGFLIAVGGEKLPTKTGLFADYYTDNRDTGSAAYGELSVFTHPTAQASASLSEWWGMHQGQVVYRPLSRVHDEGRLLEPATLGFVKAMKAVTSYLGRDLLPFVKWSDDLFTAIMAWCKQNGCRD